MSKQLTLGAGFEKYAKTTRRAQFLSEMDRIIPWTELCELIAPVYPVAGNGRPPRDLEMMLRIYFLQQWFNLSDPAAEDGLYDSVAMRRFVGLDLSESPAPDDDCMDAGGRATQEQLPRLRSAVSGTCSNGTLSARLCSSTSLNISRRTVSKWARALLSTPRSSAHRRRRRTRTRPVIRTCTRRRRATSGSSG